MMYMVPYRAKSGLDFCQISRKDEHHSRHFASVHVYVYKYFQEECLKRKFELCSSLHRFAKSMLVPEVKLVYVE